jgi:hypothetical protein
MNKLFVNITILVLLTPIFLYAETTVESGLIKNIQPVYGISGHLEKWDKENIPVAYNPTGSAFLSDDPIRLWMQNAINVWERVSGINFGTVIEDKNISTQSWESFYEGNYLKDERASEKVCPEYDGIIVVNWLSDEDKPEGDWKAQAPRKSCQYNYDNGRFDVVDGMINMNDDALWEASYSINSIYNTDSTLVHELGHIIGLGHSNVPLSTMYANPYNSIIFLQTDDIRAAQVLYGKSNKFVDRTSLSLEWGVQSRFEKNLIFKNMPDELIDYFACCATITTSPDVGIYFFNSETLKDESEKGALKILSEEMMDKGLFFLQGWTDIFTTEEGEKDFEVTSYITDEYGVPLSSTSGTASCYFNTTIGDKNWCRLTVFIPSPPAALDSNFYKLFVILGEEIIYESEISTVYQTPHVFNENPTATLTVAKGSTLTSSKFEISATDNNSDQLTVTWRPPGRRDLNGDGDNDARVIDTTISGASTSREFDFDVQGWHEFFIEINDTEERYGRAGSGFQTLFKVLTHIPADKFPVKSYVIDTNTVYIDQPTDVYKSAGAVIKIKDSTNTSAKFSFSTSKDHWSSSANPTTFSENDFLNIIAKIEADPEDIGANIEFFVAIKSVTNGDVKLYQMNSDMSLSEWNGAIPRLEPMWEINEADGLPAYRKVWDFEIISGQLNKGDHSFFLGYRNVDIDGPIHVNPKGFKVSVN